MSLYLIVDTNFNIMIQTKINLKKTHKSYFKYKLYNLIQIENIRSDLNTIYYLNFMHKSNNVLF